VWTLGLFNEDWLVRRVRGDRDPDLEPVRVRGLAHADLVLVGSAAEFLLARGQTALSGSTVSAGMILRKLV
jgi:hypothetical protein